MTEQLDEEEQKLKESLALAGGDESTDGSTIELDLDAVAAPRVFKKVRIFRFLLFALCI